MLFQARRPSWLLCYLLLTSCYVGVVSPSMESDATSGTSDLTTDGVDETGSDATNESHMSGAEIAFPGVSGTPATMMFETPEGPIELDYVQLDNGFGILEGDIILYGPTERSSTGANDGIGTNDHQDGASINWIGRRWPNREIPWRFATSSDQLAGSTLNVPSANIETAVTDAIAVIEASVNVDFVDYDSNVHRDYVEIYDGGNAGCFSYIGRKGGRQHLGITDGCIRAPNNSAIHELGHAIGLFHEQSRTDRAIMVDWANIEPGKEANFQTHDADRRGNYDLQSIMHYGSCSFSVCRDPANSNMICEDNTQTICTYSRRAAQVCGHCDCGGPGPIDCSYPTIRDANGNLIQEQRSALRPSDIESMEYALGCPSGYDGDYCGGPVGLEWQTLYTCADGYYSVNRECPSGTCTVAPVGVDDVCSPVSACPSGNGWYCGQAVGLTPGTLYWCMNGGFSMGMPCPDDECVLAGSMRDDHCIGEEPPPPPDPGPSADCIEGLCCDASGSFRPAGTVCADNAESQFGCPWGTAAGEDVGVQYRDRTCSGTSEACDGPYAAWETWQTQDVCSAAEYCDPGDPTCNMAPAMPDCAGGPCCDASGFYRPAGFTCVNDADSQYGCPWGTIPGDDVGVQYRDQTCSGTSELCNGSYGAWEAWQTQDACAATEICAPGDPTCNPCAASYWIPTNTSDTEWDSMGIQQLQLQKQELNGSTVQARICKIGGGNFTNNIHLDYEEWAKYNGLFMYSGTVISAGMACSNWINLDTSTWNEGDNLGAEVRVVSPSTCEALWDDQCSVNPGCGNCWFWLSDTTMQRTCL